MSWARELAELERRKALAARMGGTERVKRQHDAGRLTVRERVERLVDVGSFHEIGAIAGQAEYDASNELTDFTPANCIFGRAKIEGRGVVVVGDDFTVRGGSADASIREKPMMAEEMAATFRAADRAHHRGIGRRWIRQDHRNEGAREFAGAGGRDARLFHDDRQSGQRAGRRAGARLRRRPRGGTARVLALFHHDEVVRHVRCGPARGRAARAGPQQAGPRWMAGADAIGCGRPRRRYGGRGVRLRAALSVLPAALRA